MITAIALVAIIGMIAAGGAAGFALFDARDARRQLAALEVSNAIAEATTATQRAAAAEAQLAAALGAAKESDARVAQLVEVAAANGGVLDAPALWDLGVPPPSVTRDADASPSAGIIAAVVPAAVPDSAPAKPRPTPSGGVPRRPGVR